VIDVLIALTYVVQAVGVVAIVVGSAWGLNLATKGR